MKGERGFALILTLVITAILVALVVEFISEVYVDTSSRQYAVDAQQASLLADSGMTGSIQLLKKELGGKAYTSLQDRWATPLVLEEEKGTLKVTVEEENGKLSLNHLYGSNGETIAPKSEEIVKRLFRKLGLSLDLLDALADWVDTNDEPHPGGAESNWYLAQKPPYHAKNGPLETVEELAMVKGFDGKPLAQLRPFVTVYADNQMVAAPININTAPKEILAVLADGMTDEMAQRIIDYRKSTPFQQPSDLNRVSGMDRFYTGLQGIYTVKGSVYRLRSEATVNNTVRVIEAVVRLNGTADPAKLYWREY